MDHLNYASREIEAFLGVAAISDDGNFVFDDPSTPFRELRLRRVSRKKTRGVLDWTTNDLTDLYQGDDGDPVQRDLYGWAYFDSPDPVRVLRRIADDIEAVRQKMQELGYSRRGPEVEGYEWFSKEIGLADVATEVRNVLNAFLNHGDGVYTPNYDPRTTA